MEPACGEGLGFKNRLRLCDNYLIISDNGWEEWDGRKGLVVGAKEGLKRLNQRLAMRKGDNSKLVRIGVQSFWIQKMRGSSWLFRVIASEEQGASDATRSTEEWQTAEDGKS